MRRPRFTALAFALCAGLASAPAVAFEPWSVLAQSKKLLRQPPWPPGDERGMANQIGPATWVRCAWHLGQAKAKAYELSQLRSNTMPLSPFSGPYALKPKPSAGIPGSAHGFNSEAFNEGAEPAAQATQMDALGRFAYLAQPWDGKPPFPAESLRYYGGYTQAEVKPGADSPLLKLGIEKAPPTVTSAVLLDAMAAVGGGQPMKAGELVTLKDIQAMLKAQRLDKRGILLGDVVYIRTGWGEQWRDPDTEKTYYAKAPGLAYDAAKFLGERRIVALGLDTPFADPVPEGLQMGIHHIENVRLDELARDKVWTSCTMILPLRDQGAAGSPVRPVAVGLPGQ